MNFGNEKCKFDPKMRIFKWLCNKNLGFSNFQICLVKNKQLTINSFWINVKNTGFDKSLKKSFFYKKNKIKNKKKFCELILFEEFYKIHQMYF